MAIVGNHKALGPYAEWSASPWSIAFPWKLAGKVALWLVVATAALSVYAMLRPETQSDEVLMPLQATVRFGRTDVLIANISTQPWTDVVIEVDGVYRCARAARVETRAEHRVYLTDCVSMGERFDVARRQPRWVTVTARSEGALARSQFIPAQ